MNITECKVSFNNYKITFHLDYNYMIMILNYNSKTCIIYSLKKISIVFHSLDMDIHRFLTMYNNIYFVENFFWPSILVCKILLNGSEAPFDRTIRELLFLLRYSKVLDHFFNRTFPNKCIKFYCIIPLL